jgi:uncharacterized protein (DUF1330 family)
LCVNTLFKRYFCLKIARRRKAEGVVPPMENIQPLAEQIKAFMSEEDDESPIVMINLLKYREQAKYPEGMDVSPCTGREAYQRYGAAAAQKLKAVGAKAIWMGNVKGVVIGPLAESWDDALLVEYPSRKAFADMAFDKGYESASVHRTAALADSRLIAVKARLNLFEGLNL